MLTLQRFVPVAALLIASAFTGHSAMAAGASGNWAEGPHTRARLIAASRSGGEAGEIAIQIELDQGWKTYWRNPGDAGVPPQLDWSRSGNLKSSAAAWPIPKRLPDPYGQSIGYKGGLVIPVRLSASDAGQPVTVRLEMEYGVCAEVCIPVTVSLALELAPQLSTSPHDELIARWKARTPSTSADGNGLTLAAVAALNSGKTGLLITIEGAGGLKAPDLLVEGPADFYFTIPELVSQKADQAVFRIEIDGAKSLSELKGHSMTLTLIGNKKAREIKWPLGKLLKQGPA